MKDRSAKKFLQLWYLSFSLQGLIVTILMFSGIRFFDPSVGFLFSVGYCILVLVYTLYAKKSQSDTLFDKHFAFVRSIIYEQLVCVTIITAVFYLADMFFLPALSGVAIYMIISCFVMSLSQFVHVRRDSFISKRTRITLSIIALLIGLMVAAMFVVAGMWMMQNLSV